MVKRIGDSLWQHGRRQPSLMVRRMVVFNQNPVIIRNEELDNDKADVQPLGFLKNAIHSKCIRANST